MKKKLLSLAKIVMGLLILIVIIFVVIPIIIASFAIPSIMKVTNDQRIYSFEAEANTIIKNINYKVLGDNRYDPTKINETNIEREIDHNAYNYESVTVMRIDGEIYIVIVGKNQWDGLKVCGFYIDMKVGKDIECIEQ